MNRPLSAATDRIEPSYLVGVLLVVLAGVFWSTMGIGIRFIDEAGVWHILLYRSAALAVFLLAVIAIRSGGKPLEAVRRAGTAGVIGACGLVMAFSGAIHAIQTTTVANAMFLFAAAPFIAALLGKLVLGEQVRGATWWFMFIALSGIVSMVLSGFAAGRAEGNASALAAATGFAVFTVSLRRGRLGDMMPAVFLAGAFGVAVSLAVCLWRDLPLLLSPNDALIACALGVFQVGAGLTVYTLGSRSVPAAELALLSMTEVVLGPLWVWLLLDESPSAATLVGGGILLAAIAGNALSGLRRRPVPIL